jgi:hypothetical protein
MRDRAEIAVMRRTKRKAEKAKQRENKRERKRNKSVAFPGVSAF